jgi:electron-transferring-flavoprotein dehydrogenase
MPAGHHKRDWAVGMKMVVDLPEGSPLEPGTVFHTLGYPEPEIFGFFYVLPGNVAALGIFVPSWFDSPVRTSYRYLQYWMQHPYLWKWLKGGRLRSWGAKSLQESGRTGEPWLAGDGYARIGEGSGSTNVLTNSGVDEAWTTGSQLGEAILELLKAGKEFTRENLESAYVARRRASWVEADARVAEKARAGFQQGFIQGMIGTALTGFTKGLLAWPGQVKRPHERIPSLEAYCEGRVSPSEIGKIRAECKAQGKPVHDAIMSRMGWPEIEHDGQLLMSHQDALLQGGKVQAPAGYADHVVFLYPHLCETCGTQLCAEVCSAQAITVNPDGPVPLFDREKCVHCGACLWNCARQNPDDPEMGNIKFSAGAGGLHSVEN